MDTVNLLQRFISFVEPMKEQQLGLRHQLDFLITTDLPRPKSLLLPEFWTQLHPATLLSAL